MRVITARFAERQAAERAARLIDAVGVASRLQPLLGDAQRFVLACYVPDEARPRLVSDTRTILAETGGEIWSDADEDLRDS